MAFVELNYDISKAVEEEAEPLERLSGVIWNNPELGLAEKVAHGCVTDFLEARGFQVTRNLVLDTAFRAVYKQGNGGTHVAFVCEYDALPDIGHACGHNLIAEAGVAAALGLKAALQAHPTIPATLSVIGTPDEEGSGGKLDLIEAGVFSSVDICMMAHPDKTNMMAPIVLAVNAADVVFTGQAAHAAAAPWEGINALDAAVNAYTAMSMLRQQLKPDCRIHAVITEGGTRPNIIPERTVMKIFIRATTDSQLGVLKTKLKSIMESAALAAGCAVSVVFEKDTDAQYSNMISNPRLVEHYRKHWQMCDPLDATVCPDRVWASTDMGNVSYVVPSIHPTFSIGTSANVHTREFAAAAIKGEAHAATRCCAKAMAAVGWDVLTNSELLQEVKAVYKGQLTSCS